MAAPYIAIFHDGQSDSNRLIVECLNDHNLQFSEKNTRKDGEAAALVQHLCGDEVSPVVYAGERWLPDPTQEEVLRAAGVDPDVSTLDSRGLTVFDVVVVGLGPAGLAACHGCRLGGLSVLGLDENEPGGHLLGLTDVDEYFGVGYDEEISGREVADNFTAHARHVGAVLMRARVESIRMQGGFKRVHTSAGNFWSRAVIVATGAAQQELAIQGVERFVNRGIRYGAQVDAHVYAGRRVCVVGGGDEAMHAAIFLGEHAQHVTVLCPDDAPTAQPLLVKRAAAVGVRVISRSRVIAVRGGDSLDYLFFMERGIEEEQGLPIDAMVIALGPAPKTPIPGLERLPQEHGYYAHGEGGKTMFGGIYVAGDCTNIQIRTLMSVVASGSLCAKRLWQWLAANPLPMFARDPIKGRTIRIPK